MLTVDALACHLGGFELHDATFRVDAGDYFVLLGASGAGKTVLLELLAGLLVPDRGQLTFDGRDITRCPIQKRPFGLVYQDHVLFPHLTVRRNIAYALPRSSHSEVERLADQVGAGALLDRAPGTLSLGEAQRVAIARTLAHRPRVLMLDEPLASLDVQARTGIRALLRRLHAAGQTIIHVTHDYEEALALASRVAVLEAGRIVQVGTPEEVFHHPRSQFIARFVGIKNFFRGRLVTTGGRAQFETAGVRFAVAAEASDGSGCAVFESNAVTVSLAEPCGSARNVFFGTVTDLEPAPLGIELTLACGVTLQALITRQSRDEMGLAIGTPVWASFKSTNVRFIPDECREHTGVAP